ncbi:MAG: hypothetical protein IKP51_01295 [Treponema sp.]|nr:hypothetical protein [Treponema sp.]
MKLEPLFTSKDNSLFAIDGTAVSTENCSLLGAKDLTASSQLPADNKCPLLVNISWEEIGLDETSYNEELLANLRDFLKVLDEQNRFAIIVPEAGNSGLTDAQKENFTASCKHCARRIKDCKSVIGFAIPEEADAATFMEELSQKHAHYIYFSKNAPVLKNSSVVRL